MKKFLYIIAFLTLGTAFTTKANPTDPTHHSFLKPQYKGVFTENNLSDFVAILKKAAQGDKTYFQDPYIDERLAAHFEAVLGDQYPGNPIAVIDGMKWLRAEDFTGNLQMGMITLDYKSTDWDPNWRPRKGEMLGMYGDIPLISSYCGNLTKGRFIAPQQPAVNTVPNQPTVTVKTENPPAYNNQQIVVNNTAKEISYAEGDAIGRARADERELAITHGALLAKDLMISGSELNKSNCCATSTVGASNVVYVQPSQPQGGGENYGPQEVISRYKPNALDYINTAANVGNAVFNGINTIRGYKSYNPQQSYTRGYNRGGGYHNGGGGYGNNVPYYGGTDLRSQGPLPPNLYNNGTGIIRGSHPYSNNASTGNVYGNTGGYTNGNNGSVYGLYNHG